MMSSRNSSRKQDNEVEFGTMEELNGLLKRRKQGNQIAQLSARQPSIKSQVSEDQHGGNPNGMPLHYFSPQAGGNPNGMPLHYFSPQAGGNPNGMPLHYFSPQSGGRKGGKAQTGGRFDSLWGANQPTFNTLSQPNFNTVYGQTGGLSNNRERGRKTQVRGHKNQLGGCGCSGNNQQGGGDDSYSRSTVVDSVAQATGDRPEDVEGTINTVYGRGQKDFTEDDIANLTDIHNQAKHELEQETSQKQNDVEQLSEDFQHLSLKPKRRANQVQKGGNPNGMPWEWYHPIGSISTPLSGPSGNSPSLIGGGQKGQRGDKIADLNRRGGAFSELGSENEVLTDANRKELFNYLYQTHPQLRNSPQTAHIFEDAEKDDAYIWSELQEASVPQAVDYIKGQTLSFYENTYPTDQKGLQNLKTILS